MIYTSFGEAIKSGTNCALTDYYIEFPKNNQLGNPRLETG
jgi:hypothetical protein